MWICSCSCISYLGILGWQGQLWERVWRWGSVGPALRETHHLDRENGIYSDITQIQAEAAKRELQIKSLGGRAEGISTSQWDRPDLELCPMIMTTTVSFIEHVPCVLQGVLDKEVSFRTEGLITSRTVGCQPSWRIASDEGSCMWPVPSPRFLSGTTWSAYSLQCLYWDCTVAQLLTLPNSASFPFLSQVLRRTYPIKLLHDDLNLRVCFPGSPIHDT